MQQTPPPPKTPPPPQQPGQKAQGPAKLVCPLMSYATTVVPCVREQCALWEDITKKCAYLAQVEMLSTKMEQLMMSLNDIRSRL